MVKEEEPNIITPKSVTNEKPKTRPDNVVPKPRYRKEKTITSWSSGDKSTPLQKAVLPTAKMTLAGVEQQMMNRLKIVSSRSEQAMTNQPRITSSISEKHMMMISQENELEKMLGSEHSKDKHASPSLPQFVDNLSGYTMEQTKVNNKEKDENNKKAKGLARRKKTMIDIMSDEMEREMMLENMSKISSQMDLKSSPVEMNNPKIIKLDSKGLHEPTKSMDGIKKDEVKLLLEEGMEEKEEKKTGEGEDSEDGSDHEVDVDERVGEDELREYGLSYDTVNFDDDLDFAQDELDEKEAQRWRHRDAKKIDDEEKDFRARMDTRLILYKPIDSHTREEVKHSDAGNEELMV
jgi:hypothetical protein